jgi:L-ascorbate metabolism protein UlaG (beta-lactamase superfamily)
VLRGRILHLRRQGGPVDAAALGRIDAVLISHDHRDHLDVASLRLLAGEQVAVVVPKGSARHVAELGFGSVHELAEGEAVAIGAAEITATAARHETKRHPLGAPGGCVGYLISAAGRRVYFAGDTDLFPEMAAIGDRLDVALLPVWGWGTSLGPGHLDPLGAAEALALLQPRLAIPIHWGTLLPVGSGRSHGHLLSDPPRRFAQEAARLAPGVEVRVLEPGASTPLPAAAA